MRNFFLGLDRLVSAAHRVAGFWSGLDHFLPSAEWAPAVSRVGAAQYRPGQLPHLRILGVAHLNFLSLHADSGVV